MKKYLIPLLLMLLAACNLPQTAPPATVAPLPPEAPTATAAAVQPCFYVWAYQALPELTAEWNTAIQKILPKAEGSVSAYGENCVAEDGSATFGAMQTDFYLRIEVKDLEDEAALGIIIEQVLAVADQFARPRVPGPNDGFVECTFLSGEDQRVVRVPIPLGRQLREQGLRGAELFQAIQKQ